MHSVGKFMMVAVAAFSMTACVNSEQTSTVPPGGGPTFPAPEPPSISSSQVPQPGTVTALPAGQTPAGQPKECTAEDVVVTGQPEKKPKVTIPSTCAKPATLLSEDLVAGTGTAAKAGSTVEINYLLVTWSDKKEVAQTFASGETQVVQNLGQAKVVPAWNEGLIGLKQGGRRLLVVPPGKGYGPAGQDEIKANETLVYVVDAVKVS